MSFEFTTNSSPATPSKFIQKIISKTKVIKIYNLNYFAFVFVTKIYRGAVTFGAVFFWKVKLSETVCSETV